MNVCYIHGASRRQWESGKVGEWVRQNGIMGEWEAGSE